MLTEKDLRYLRRCVELAQMALERGNPPFGSLLVDAGGHILKEDFNQVNGGDPIHHPELAVTRWAAEHLSTVQRAATTVYTSGEHCAMCAAAHGWTGMGRIVYATSSAQLASWKEAWHIKAFPVRPLAIEQVLTRVDVDGPAPTLADDIKALQRRYFKVPASN